MQLCVYYWSTKYVNIGKYIVLYIIMNLRCLEDLEQTVQYKDMVKEWESGRPGVWPSRGAGCE